MAERDPKQHQPHSSPSAGQPPVSHSPGEATTDARQAEGHLEHPRVRRETRDVRFRWVLAFVVVSLVVGPLQLVLVWRAYQEGERRVQQENMSQYPLARREGARLPKDPRLEQLNRTAGIEQDNVRRIESVDLKRLDHFGKTGVEGFVHIPIEDAMDLVVERLPVSERSGHEDFRSRGLVDGGESNSGRMFRGNVQ